MTGGAGRPWEFPKSDQWVLVKDKLHGAPQLLHALLSGSPDGVHVRREIRLLCATAVRAQDRWMAAHTTLVATPP